MPPKKDDKKGAAEAPADDGSERELVEKELVIGYLKSKLGRYQDFGDRLQVENVKLNDELETQKLNLRDINEFLTNELKARSLTTSAMEAKVVELYHLLDDVNKSHEEGLAKLKRDKDRQIDALDAKIQEYERRARGMAEFQEKKDVLEAELNALKESLHKKVKDYEAELTDMDRQHIQDREKWKRETATKIKETKIQMMKLTDNQLEMTTKRTIMENEQMSIELSYQSRQTEKLLSRNNVLLEENSDLRRQLELSNQTEGELAKRNNVYQKTIKSLLTKLKEQGMQQDESGGVVSELESHIMDLDSQLHLAQLQGEELQHQLKQAKAKLGEKTAQIDVWSARHNQASQFLMTCLEDVKEKIVTLERPATDEDGGNAVFPSPTAPPPLYRPSPFGGGIPEPPLPDVAVLPGRLEDLSAEQRERVLAHLLERLHTFTKSQQLEAATAVGGSSGGLMLRSSLLPATGGAGQGASAASRRSAGGLGNGVSLPRISAVPRRSAASTLPISQSVVSAAQEAASTSLMGMALAASGGRSRGGFGASASATGGLHPVQESSTEYEMGASKAGGLEAIPPVDDLLSRVMSEVRPWGKRSQELGLTASRQGVFLKRGVK